MLGNTLTLPLSLVVGIYAIVAECEWPPGFRVITQVAGVLLITSSILLQTGLIMFLVASDFLAGLILVAQFFSAAFIALVSVFGITTWPDATKRFRADSAKRFVKPLSILLALLLGFQFAGRVVAVLFY